MVVVVVIMVMGLRCILLTKWLFTWKSQYALCIISVTTSNDTIDVTTVSCIYIIISDKTRSVDGTSQSIDKFVLWSMVILPLIPDIRMVNDMILKDYDHGLGQNWLPHLRHSIQPICSFSFFSLKYKKWNMWPCEFKFWATIKIEQI